MTSVLDGIARMAVPEYVRTFSLYSLSSWTGSTLTIKQLEREWLNLRIRAGVFMENAGGFRTKDVATEHEFIGAIRSSQKHLEYSRVQRVIDLEAGLTSPPLEVPQWNDLLSITLQHSSSGNFFHVGNLIKYPGVYLYNSEWGCCL